MVAAAASAAGSGTVSVGVSLGIGVADNLIGGVDAAGQRVAYLVGASIGGSVVNVAGDLRVEAVSANDRCARRGGLGGGRGQRDRRRGPTGGSGAVATNRIVADVQAAITGPDAGAPQVGAVTATGVVVQAS